MRICLRFLVFVAFFFCVAGALAALLIGAAATRTPQLVALAPVVVFGSYVVFCRTCRSRSSRARSRVL